MITIDDFKKVELKVGKVLSAEAVEGSEKLLKLRIDVGEAEPRQVLSGIAKWYPPENLIGIHGFIQPSGDCRRIHTGGAALLR